MNGDVDRVVVVGAIESELNSSIVSLLLFGCHNGSLTCFLTSVRPVLALIVDMASKPGGETGQSPFEVRAYFEVAEKVWITGLEALRV